MTEVLEWQLRNIRTNADIGANKKTFGIQYYDLEKNVVRQPASFYGLIVFTCEASESLRNNVAELCIKQIIPIVKEEKLPFILCLKHADIKYSERNMVFLKEAMRTLQTGLNTTHLVIRTESPLGKLNCLVDLWLVNATGI
jgi:hypothetical protein